MELHHNPFQAPRPGSEAGHLRVVKRSTTTDLMLDPGFPYGEDLLQFIWEQRLFDGHALRTTDGQPLEVIKPGRIQSNSGPDLDGAQLRIAGQLWAGAVEVHLRSSEWNAHGHQFDPAYESVVLHVVFQHDVEVRTLAGRVPPTLELLQRVSTDSIGLFQELMRSKAQVPCARLIHRVDPLRTGPWLERLLVERLERKTAGAEALHNALGRDPAATLYHMLARAFGMKVNAEPFGMLAHALPLKLILKYRDDALRTEALLFGQAGMLQVDFVDEHPRALQQEYRLLAHMHGLWPAPLAAWKFARMRPVNFPTLRIAQFARLLMRCDGTFNELLEQDDVERVRAFLEVEAGPYWADRYRFDRPATAVAKRMGRAGADHLIINAVAPALFALGRSQGNEAWKDRAMRLLEQLPAEKNGLLDGWRQLGVNADSAARGQALIELKNIYCTRKRCLSCGFGGQLFRNTLKGQAARIEQ